MMTRWFLFLLLAAGINCVAKDTKTEHVFLVTLDGTRWQEVFSGAEE
jgi:hypothetical protein